MADSPRFSGDEWETKPAEALGFNAAKSEDARRRIAEHAGSDARDAVVVARGGYKWA